MPIPSAARGDAAPCSFSLPAPSPRSAWRRSLGLTLGSLAALALAPGCGGHARGASGASTASPVASAQPIASATTPALPLRLLTSSPAAGETRVALDRALRLEFDAALDLATLGSEVAILLQGQPQAVALVASGAVVELRPSSSWPAGVALEVAIGSGLRALHGGSAATTSFSFQTFAGPAAPRALALPGGPRSAAASVELSDGRILTCGGTSPAPLAAADLFDPAAGSLRATGALREARADHTLSALRDGRALAAGGAGAGPLTSLELYDPHSGRWRALAARLASPRLQHQAFRLPSGRVALVGGLDAPPHQGGRPLGTIEVFDPADESLTLQPGPAFPPSDWVQLPDGRLLNLTAGLVIDLDRPGAPVPTANALGTPRSYLAVATLPDGRLVLAGGASGFGAGGSPTLHAEVDLFDPATLRFEPAAPLRTARFGARALLLGDGQVALVGGAVAQQGPPAGATSLELWTPASGTTAELVTPALDGVSALALARGGLLVTGSRTAHTDPSTASALALWFEPAALEARPLPPHLSGVAARGARDLAHVLGGCELVSSQPLTPASVSSASVSLLDASGQPVACELVLAPDGTSLALLPRAPLRPQSDYAVVTSGLLAGGQSLPATRHALRTAPVCPLGAGALLVVDKPTTGGPQALYRAEDRNGDGDFDDAGELSLVFQAPAGANLQDPCQAPDGALYLPDSGADVLWRLRDLDGDGAASAPGEAEVYFRGAALPLSSPASAAIARDGAVLLADNGTGGAQDGIWRLRDLDGDGDVADPGEALLYNGFDYAGAIWGLQVDLRGDLWHTVTGAGGNLVVRHQDRDGDGNTHGAGERSVVQTASEFVTDLAPLPSAPGLGVWSGIGAARRLANPDGTLTRFSDPTGVLSSSASLAGGAGGRLILSTLSGQLYALVDLNQDGDFDDVDELVRRYGGGALARPYYLAFGQAPPAPRLSVAPRVGATTLEGVGVPHAELRLELAGQSVSVPCDAQGVFQLPLPQPLAAGDRLSLRCSGLGGSSRALEVELP